MSSCILRCAIACVDFHVEGENVLFGVILFSSSVTRASAFLLRAVNCLACVDCLRRGVGSLRLQLCSEVAVRLTTLMLFHSMYIAWSFAADSTNKFNKAFIRSHHRAFPSPPVKCLPVRLWVAPAPELSFFLAPAPDPASVRFHTLIFSIGASSWMENELNQVHKTKNIRNFWVI